MPLRTAAWLTSFALHLGVVAFFLVTPGGASLEEGSGEDAFIVEQGAYQEYIAAVEAPPPALASAPPVQEVKPIEEDAQAVISSEHGPDQEKVVEEIEEVVKEPPKEQVAAVQQTELAVEEQKAKEIIARTGGDTTAISAYRGKLFSHISKKKVNPRSKFAGTAVVRFTIGPQGELISREISSSSGSKVLDDAAVASIDRAAPFPAMPADVGDEPMIVSVPFKFSVR
ncbi:energy transducer TonB family protein [Hyphomicrobium sp.]|uniref:energy transducer TonB family protein n=1 Tax=Hyphomicrobium sp. TaxID=82 RepID=UPI002FE1A381